jgi:GNAT superfamily N-acetyltransferase
LFCGPSAAGDLGVLLTTAETQIPRVARNDKLSYFDFVSAMLSIRAARASDVGLLRTMIREFAEFERQLHLVTITEVDLLRDGFGPKPKFRALIVEWDNQPAGYALFFGCYSTWTGPGLFLEDIYVRDEFRGKGLGKGLLAAVARMARAGGCRSLQWEVLDWNEKAIALYRALGAEFLDDWRTVRLTGDAFQRLAERE